MIAALTDNVNQDAAGPRLTTNRIKITVIVVFAPPGIVA
jgi:hypothetical protein